MAKKKNTTKIVITSVLVILALLFFSFYTGVFSIAGLGDVYFQSCSQQNDEYPAMSCYDSGFSSFASSTDPTYFITGVNGLQLNKNQFYADIVETYIFETHGIVLDVSPGGSYSGIKIDKTASEIEIQELKDMGYSILEDSESHEAFVGDQSSACGCSNCCSSPCSGGRWGVRPKACWNFQKTIKTIFGYKMPNSEVESILAQTKKECVVTGDLSETETSTTQSFEVVGTWTHTGSQLNCKITDNVPALTERPWDSINAVGVYHTFKTLPRPVIEEPIVDEEVIEAPPEEVVEEVIEEPTEEPVEIPIEEPTPEEVVEPNFLEKIINWFKDLSNYLFGGFR